MIVYVQRNEKGEIVSLSSNEMKGFEMIDSEDQEVIEFLKRTGINENSMVGDKNE